MVTHAFQCKQNKNTKERRHYFLQPSEGNSINKEDFS
nr:MAG TPA: hypothetical protein [Caudoviricetes sp.]